MRFFEPDSNWAVYGGSIPGYLYVIIPKGFLPEQDSGFIFGYAQAREDISFAATSASTSTA